MEKITLKTAKKGKVFSSSLKKEEIQLIFNTEKGLIVDRSKLAHIVLNNPYKSIIHTLLDAESLIEIIGNGIDSMGNKTIKFLFVSYKKYNFYPFSYIYRGVASRDLACEMVEWNFNSLFEIVKDGEN